MGTAAIMFWILRAFNFTVDIRNVCVLLAPFFAANTTIVAYLFGKQAKNSGTGLLAAAMMAIVPGTYQRVFD